MAGSKKKGNNTAANPNKVKVTIKTSGECEVCKKKCNAGIAYIQKMNKPGAHGTGVVCKG
jgi:hypothetical protein